VRTAKQSEHGRGVWGHAPSPPHENFEFLKGKTFILSYLKKVELAKKESIFFTLILYETFCKFINFINCPLTKKVWENPVYGTFNLYLPYAFFSACVLFI
jgi:hypothetical protein